MDQAVGASLGVIMLDTTFARPPGDVGHPASWRCPVRFARVQGASPDRVIRHDAEGLIPDFVAAGRELIAAGCGAIITSCGFMARHQRTVAEELGVAFAASSLLQLPMVARSLGKGRVPGVLTYDASSLGPENFLESGADAATPFVGMPERGAFRSLIEGGARYDAAALEREMLAAARDLVLRRPDVGAIVLECTNMPPFAQAVSKAFGLPVFDILTLGHWLFAATAPRRFEDERKV